LHKNKSRLLSQFPAKTTASRCDAVSKKITRPLKALYAVIPELKGHGFHITRRTFATRQLKSGIGYQYVSDLLGHRDTSSLHHYLNHDEDRMRMCAITLDEAGIPCSGFLSD